MSTMSVPVVQPGAFGSQQDGDAAKAFTAEAAAKREELRSQGVTPCTIINFNPVPLTLEGELKRYRVPSPDDERLPKDVSRVSLAWRGREWMGHALIVREPHIFGKPTGATAHNGIKGQPIVQRAVQFYTPAAVGYHFLEHYSAIFVTKKDGMITAPPKDARRFFGVLVFEGDLTALAVPQELTGEEREEYRRKLKIRVPLARMFKAGNVQRRIYETVEYPLGEYLEHMFRGQRTYADAVIAAAQRMHTEGKGRDEIGESQRIWYRWAIRMGYAPAPKDPDKTWLNELLTLAPAPGEQGDEPLRKCPGCRTPEQEPGQPFCHNCNRPMDTFRTFMEGHPVPEVYLQALTGDERTQALAEYRRRKRDFGEDDEPSGQRVSQAASQSVNAAAGKAVRGPGGKFVKAADPAANAAASAVLPGEEELERERLEAEETARLAAEKADKAKA